MLRQNVDDYEMAEMEMTKIRALNRAILNFIVNIIKSQLLN